MPYSDLDRLVGPMFARGGKSLWRRALTLGPAPEFCLLADPPPTPGSELDPLVVTRTRVWPDA
jgi:hypothetical protein